MFSAETDDQANDLSMIEDPTGPVEVGLNVGLRIIELEFQDRVTPRGEGGLGRAAGSGLEGGSLGGSLDEENHKTLVRLLVSPHSGVEIINEEDYQKSLHPPPPPPAAAPNAAAASEESADLSAYSPDLRRILEGKPLSLTRIPLHLVNSSAIDRYEAKQSSQSLLTSATAAAAAAAGGSATRALAELQANSSVIPEASASNNSHSRSSSSCTNGNSSKNIQGQQQILPPIEVGLQLGHPAIIPAAEPAAAAAIHAAGDGAVAAEEKAEEAAVAAAVPEAEQERSCSAVIAETRKPETADSAAQTEPPPEAAPPPAQPPPVEVAHAEVQTHAVEPEPEAAEAKNDLVNVVHESPARPSKPTTTTTSSSSQTDLCLAPDDSHQLIPTSAAAAAAGGEEQTGNGGHGADDGAKQVGLARSPVQALESNVNAERTAVTSETQTSSVLSEDFGTQTETEPESIVDRSDGAVQTDEEETIRFNPDQSLHQQFSTDTLSYSDVIAEQPSRPVDSANLPARPPTLPGSSVDIPNEFEDDLNSNQPTFTDRYSRERETTFINSARRTRTVSPACLKVQDDVVARVLLEHVGTVFPENLDSRLRSGVNYLDLSRLGDEGETPASDEIWLAVDGSGCHSEGEDFDRDDGLEDKFLTTDDTETYSIATDKLSTAATLAGYGNVLNLDLIGDDDDDRSNCGPLLPNSGGLLGPADLAGSRANLLSEQELALGCESFDAEAEATARLQGVLASELTPLHKSVKATGLSLENLTDKFANMETVLGSVSNTIDSLQSMVNRPPGTQSRQGSQEGEPNDGISIRRTSNPGAVKRSSINIDDFKNTDVRLLDQLVARIEHLSSDVANMDASRQLRDDNLLLRKELQTYRERELQMNNRLEQLEKRLNDLSGGGSRKNGGNGSDKKGSRHRRSSIGSNSSRKSTPELPPIDQGPRSRSVDSRKEQKEKDKKAIFKESKDVEIRDVLPSAGSGSDSDSNRQKTVRPSDPPSVSGLLKPSDKISADLVTGGHEEFSGAIKQPLINAQLKLNKKGGMKIPRRTSNSSSGSSGSDTEIKGRTKKGAITPKLGEDYLQTEIQIQRSDNSILRQDIQVFRTREQQLYSRNQDLQDKLVDALSPRHSAKTEKVQEQVQSEAVINVDFVGENEFDGPKAVFEAKTKPAKGKRESSAESSRRSSSKDRRSSRDSSKERGKPGPLKKAPSSERIAVPKTKKKSPPQSEHDEAETEPSTKQSSASSDGKKSVKMAESAKNGVPKTKPTANGKKPTAAAAGKKPPAKSPKGSVSSEKDVEEKAVTSAGSERLLEDDEWKVTIASKDYELETIQTDPNKIVVVRPKPKVIEEVKEEVKVAKKAKVKAKKIEKVKEKKDIIPKPQMFPAARPPRGYCPPRVLPNASMGVTTAIMGAPMVLDGGPIMMGDPTGNGYRSGRASSIDPDDRGEVISMLIKQEARDSLVDAACPPRSYTPGHGLTPTRGRSPYRQMKTPAPPPICQVSYDSVYDDPYYSMSYY